MGTKTNNGRLRRLLLSGEGTRALDLVSSEAVISAAELLRALAPRNGMAALGSGAVRGARGPDRARERLALGEALCKTMERLPEALSAEKGALARFREAYVPSFWAWAILSGEDPLAGLSGESRARALQALEAACPGALGGKPLEKCELQNFNAAQHDMSLGEPAWTHGARAPRGLEAIWGPVAARKSTRSQASSFLAEACSGRSHNALALLESPELRHSIEDIAPWSALSHWAKSPACQPSDRGPGSEEARVMESDEWVRLGELLWAVNKRPAGSESELFCKALATCEKRGRFYAHESVGSAFRAVFMVAARLGWNFPEEAELSKERRPATIRILREGRTEQVSLTHEVLRSAFESYALNQAVDARGRVAQKARL